MVSLRVLLPSETSETLSALLRSRPTVWVDITGPDEEDVRVMREVFGFHPLAIEDTRNQRQRPKVETYDNHLFLILNPVHQDTEEIRFRELDVFLGDRYVVTVHPGQEPVVEEARRRVDAQSDLSPPQVVYALLDTVVDGYFPVLDALGEAIDDLEDAVLAAPRTEVLARLFQLKRMLLEMRRVVGPQRDVLNVLTRHDFPVLGAEVLRYHFRDVYDHLLRISDMLDTYRDLLTGAIDLYMSAVSNRLNQVVNRLTAFTVLIGVAAVITGFYGMNFERTWPPFGAPWGAGFALALIALVAGVLLWVFRWAGWV